MGWLNMAPSPEKSQSELARLGFFAGLAAYTMWGLFPIYFKATESVGAIEILAHRIVWSVPFGLMIILARRQWPEVWKALGSPKIMLMLGTAALALSLNWGVYIWAIQQEQIFQGSLGYYINPLIYVLVGVMFFGEKLTKWQITAVILAALGVAILTIYGGEFPYIALILACSFALYGVIRKQVDIGAMPGLMIETLIIFIPALIYLMWLRQTGQLSFSFDNPSMMGLLLLAGPITVLPLLAFAFAARRLKLSTLGILQYVGPTGQFLCALYYGETFTAAHAICFTLIWIGVIIFSLDAYKGRPKPGGISS